MVRTSQGPRHPRWGVLVGLVVLCGLVGHSESTSTKKLSDSDSSSSVSSRGSSESRSQNIGSPSDLAWQAWLLLDSQTGAHSSFDSASFLRRITPKSVFIAPELPALPPCAEGYRADTMGRCVKSVNIDHEAHLGFLLQQLNNRYGNRGGGLTSESVNNNLKKSSGPFQLNIPILSGSASQSSKVEQQETRDSIRIPIVVSSPEKVEKETVVSTKQGKNDTKVGAEEILLFLGSSNGSSSGKDPQSPASKLDMVVPVAEFVDDANETSFSEVVDYQIPIDLKTLLNISVSSDSAWRNGSTLSNSTEVAPMLILLSSTAASPNSIGPEDPPAENPRLDNGTTIRIANLTQNVTDKDAIGPSVPETATQDRAPDVPPMVGGKIENETRDGNTSVAPEEPEPFYDQDEDEDEEYMDGGDFLDEESSETEGGEILKHGEAGMPIPVKDIERLQLEKRRQQEEETLERNETSRFDLLDQVSIRFNDSGSAERDEADSRVSSEVSINGDIILETTLLDVTRNKVLNSTKVNHTSESSDEELKELLEPERGSEVMSSAETVHGTVSTDPQEGGLLEDLKNEELEAASSSSESLLYDPGSRDHQYAEDDPITEIHTMDEQPADSKEDPIPKPKEERRKNFRPGQDFGRHPAYPRQPVKFPSEEANSIHNQDYKGRVPHPLDDELHSSTKSSVFQKPFHRGASLWRTSSRQRATGQRAEAGGHRQRQQPVSISFWTAMPLMRDPSFYSTVQNAGKTSDGQRYANNKFPEVSPS